MTQTTEYATQSSFPLPDAFSAALSAIFQDVQPGIVQVRTEGRGGGTGVIWQADGRVITNNHVVPRDDLHVQVLLADGRTLPAHVLHRNPALDLALLKVTDDHLKALPMGDSAALRVGEWVFAIGHPWGQRWTVTAGIVSGASTVKLPDGRTTQYIKSDVRLAPGNSGGPLLDADGRVVGINAMIFGGDLAVSIPANVVSTWLASLNAATSNGRATLGILIQSVELPTPIARSVQPPREAGLLIVSLRIRPDYLHDLFVGDILLDVAGQPVGDPATLRHILSQQQEGASIPATILRGGKVVTVNIATLPAQTSERAA